MSLAEASVAITHPTQATPHLPLAHQPVTRPNYGSAAALESGADIEDEYYDEEEGAWEVEDDNVRLEDLFDDDFESIDETMDSWPSASPNRLTGGEGPSEDAVTSDDHRSSCLGLPLCLPYEVETLAEMDDRLEQIVCKLAECVKAREWGLGFRLWDSQLSIWMSMGYPMKKEMKIKLIFVFYEIIFVPGLSSSFIEDAGNQFIGLVSDRNLNIWDFRIPWRKLYDALYNELFPHPQRLSRHRVNLAPMYLNVAEAAQRFFHPGEVDEMLNVILPPFQPTMDSILASQTFLVHFLPVSHCSRWLPLVFRLWYGFNSGLWDDQASDLIGQLAIAHVDPGRSDPSLIDKIPRGVFNTAQEEAQNPNHARSERAHKARLLSVAGEVIEDDDGLTYWSDPNKMPEEVRMSDPNWSGIRKDVGIFSEQEFEFLMSKCLRSLNVPVGGNLASSNAMSVTTADARASRKILDAKKPIDRVQSLAETIIFCMSHDAPEQSGHATPSNSVHAAVSRLQNGASMKRGDSTDSLAQAGKSSDANRRYLAGCKALDHLSRLLTSCETFFHPSNSGPWSAFLTVFLSHLAGNFVERWKAEEDRNCKTPVAWRLTPEIKRQFVLCLRPLALTSMFNKDMESVTPAVSALKKLALLEPDLIMPALMERATPSLQGLEETQRTPAVTYALATLAQPLTVRKLWRVGGMYVGDIFTLLIPGIDLNDPAKTGLSCMAISNMVDYIRLSDISEVEEGDNVTPGPRALRVAPRPTVDDDPDDPVENEMKDLTLEDANARIRMSTAIFRDWVPEFLSRVMLLFSNLPEEGGKSGKAGGKTEALTLSSVLHTCGGVFAALDDKLFDSVLESVFEYATTTCRSNAVDAVGELVRNLAAVNAPKVFSKFFPVAKQRIVSELKAGASSTRTQTTSIPLPGDAALHWWQSILLGMLMPGRVDLTEYREEFVELLQVMIDSTYSERGWTWTGKIVEKSMSCLASIYHRELRMVNPDELKSDDFRLNHHLYWGKLYRAPEIKIDWKVPTDADIAMAFDILQLAKQTTDKVDKLLEQRAVGDQMWSNEFCRALNVIDKTLRGSYNLILEIDALKEGGKKAESYLPPDLINLPAPYKCGVVLQNANDPKYQEVLEIRRHIGETLTRAATAMRDAGQSDNSVEAVKLLVTTMGTLLTAYGIRAKQFSTAQAALNGIMATKKLYEGQRKFHRSIFLAAASVHHQNRLTTLAYNRVRSGLDDRLIVNLLDFCLSPFTRIRRSAQHVLETVARLYRGTWVLAFPKLFEALQPGTDPDTMKGALYVLRYNTLGIARIARDWRQLPRLVECLLSAHHENKASIQTLISKATEELLGSLRTTTTYEVNVRVQEVDAAVGSLDEYLTRKTSPKVVEELHNALVESRQFQDAQYDRFVDKLITIASDPSLNWRYVISASRFLLVCVRRDIPTDVRLAKYFGENAQNPHPRIRDFSMIGFTKLLFTIALRSFCQGSEEKIFLEEPDDPLSSEVILTDTSSAFTAKYLAAFREPLPEDVTTVQLQDRLSTGWLAWGTKLEVCRMTGWDEEPFSLNPKCGPAVDVLREVVGQAGWWQSLADHWAREDQRNYPSAGHIDFIVASAQLFGKPVFDFVQPIVETFLQEMDATKVYDRHKTRAMWEFLAGLIRGCEDWPGRDRAAVWNWFSSKLAELFSNIRHDTTKCWDISIEYILNERDPRRNKPLIDFCMDTALNADFNGGSAFDLSRRVQIVRSVIRCLQWRFNAWADETVDLYFKAIACPYAEVRNLLASVLNAVDQLKFHPSYPSASALTQDVLSDTSSEIDIMRLKSGPFMPQLKGIMQELEVLRKDRPHGPKAVLSPHDTSAVTTLSWITVELSDVHAVGSFPYIIPFLPQIFELRELNDNPDLQRVAGRLLAMITSITPPFDLIEPLMSKLISILQDSSSWRTKMNSMPVLSLVYFRNLSLLSESCKAKCLDVVSACLRDPNQEVREMASSTLSGFLRCSQRAMVVVLKDRFTREIDAIQLPRRKGGQPGQVNPEYQSRLVELHGAILGATALVEAFPYTVPKFVPKLLADVLAPRVSEPAPISTTIRSCVASFKRTHEKYQDKFSEDDLSAMNYAQAGNSYYA